MASLGANLTSRRHVTLATWGNCFVHDTRNDGGTGALEPRALASSSAESNSWVLISLADASSPTSLPALSIKVPSRLILSRPGLTPACGFSLLGWFGWESPPISSSRSLIATIRPRRSASTTHRIKRLVCDDGDGEPSPCVIEAKPSCDDDLPKKKIMKKSNT